MTHESYVGRVAQRVAEILSEVMGAQNGGLFSLLRRSPTVAVTWNEGSPRDICLKPTTFKFSREEPGSFDLSENGMVKVYRHPSQLTIGFRLSFPPSGSDEERLSAFDKIQTYFFDSQNIQPVLPAHLTNTALGNRIAGMAAELCLLGVELQPLVANLEYRGPFHSGTALREDKRVAHRDLRMARMPEKSSNERSSVP